MPLSDGDTYINPADGGSDPEVRGLAGSIGDMVLWNSNVTGKDEIWACNSAAPHWNRATL